jgi:betaine-aldehyde dehydrogenase
MHVPDMMTDALSFAERETSGWKLLIGGRWVDAASGNRTVTMNPSLDVPLADVPGAGAEDVAHAVDSAERAFPEWSARHVDQRAVPLRRLADAVRRLAPVFGALDALDAGNPRRAMAHEAEAAAGIIDFYCGLGMELKGETIPTPGGGLNYTRLEPFGVVARILPYNHPVLFAVSKIAAPLVAGNTVVLKIAEQTPLSGLLLGRLAQEHLPPAVLNILTGDGPNCGAALVRHPRVRRVAFTGSVATGRAVVEQAGIKQVTLELGGKNPLIVYPDVDVAKAAAAAVAGMNFTVCQGQSCGSTSRAFVHGRIHEALVDAIVEGVARIRVGLPDHEDAQMGPLITRAHHDRVLRYVDSAAREGASLRFGGRHPSAPELARGYFVEPTVFDGVTHGMTIEREEIFGPVLAVIPWEDEADMLRQANDTEFGLCANIWTKDISAALRLADRVEAGYVWINGHGGVRYRGAPFGGYKSSGIGREHSMDELVSYTQIKNVNVSY